MLAVRVLISGSWRRGRWSPRALVRCALLFSENKSVQASLFTIVFELVACGLCVGQLADPPEIAALPAWPTDGKIPSNLEKQHVFRDLTTGEIVVSYPSPGAEGRRTTFRFWL